MFFFPSSYPYGSFLFKKSDSESLLQATIRVTHSIFSKAMTSEARTHSSNLSGSKYIVKQTNKSRRNGWSKTKMSERRGLQSQQASEEDTLATVKPFSGFAERAMERQKTGFGMIWWPKEKPLDHLSSVPLNLCFLSSTQSLLHIYSSG